MNNQNKFLRAVLYSVILFSLMGYGSTASAHRIGQVGPKQRTVVPLSASLSTSLDNFFDREEAFGFSGSVIAARDDEIILHKGYGFSDRRRDAPNTPSTVFSLASLDKQFIAAAILRLEEMGKLHTTDPIAKFFDFVSEDKSAITLHHILSHTAGLRNEYWDQHPEMNRQAFVRLVLHDQPLLATPGKEWRYSNSGCIVLEEVIEQD
jgi:CubicO group peptidase (beta-lactamase class C family)